MVRKNQKQTEADLNDEPVEKPVSTKAKPKRQRKAKVEEPPGITLDRTESLPDQTLAAPKSTPSQDASPIDDALASAIAPDDEDVDVSEAALGPPRYTSLQRRTSPPRGVPFRILKKSEATKTLYMLALPREAQDEGEQDTYALTPKTREYLEGHPAFRKQIKRFQIRLGVTSLGKPFFLEVNLDDPGVWGQSRRDLAAIAETEWIFASSDRNTGYSHHPSDHEEDPDYPVQGYEELFNLTYKNCVLNSVEHPIIKRSALRKAKK